MLLRPHPRDPEPNRWNGLLPADPRRVGRPLPICCVFIALFVLGCASLDDRRSETTLPAVSAAPARTLPTSMRTPDWSVSTRSGRQALAEHRFESAEEHFVVALDSSSSLRTSDVRVGVGLGNLVRVASIYERIGRSEDATRVMDLIETALARWNDSAMQIEIYRDRYDAMIASPLPSRLIPEEMKKSLESPPFDKIILRTAESYDVDPALVKAVVAAESNFEPRAVSRVGAQGLMQLMPQTARAMGVRRPFAPSENIRGGVRYLRKLLDRFGDLDHALAAYNAGPDAVMRYGGIPPYPETEAYVTRVLSHYKRYQTRFSH